MRLVAEGLAVLALLAAAPLPGQTPPAPTVAAARQALTLDEAMTSALSASPALRAAGLGRAEAAARGDVARQRPNPEITLEETNDKPRDTATLSVPLEGASGAGGSSWPRPRRRATRRRSRAW